LGNAALATTGGDEAHALLDTLAAAQWQAGRRDLALKTQRMSLVATRAYSRHGPDAAPESQPGLPLVRLAEFELARGRRPEARLLALLALERERLYALDVLPPDAHAATGLPDVALMVRLLPASRRARLLDQAGLHDTDTPITVARARSVLATTLRAAPAPASPPAVAPAAATP